MAKCDDEVQAAAQAVVQDAVKEAAQQTAQKQKIKALEKAAAVAERVKKRAVNLYERTLESPNHPQIVVALGAAGVSAMGGYKFNEVLESKTKEWVDDEGKSTIWRKAVVHGTLPFLGAVGMIGGYFIGNGLLSSGLIGLSSRASRSSTSRFGATDAR